jgi:hypothetical protein
MAAKPGGDHARPAKIAQNDVRTITLHDGQAPYIVPDHLLDSLSQ